jgi:uncharacterized protein DUF4160
MPTVLRSGPYRFFFYSNEGSEPPHVHVEAGAHVAKFWLAPISLARAGGFSEREIGKIQRIVEQHRDELIGAWDAHFTP